MLVMSIPKNLEHTEWASLVYHLCSFAWPNLTGFQLRVLLYPNSQHHFPERTHSGGTPLIDPVSKIFDPLPGSCSQCSWGLLQVFSSWNSWTKCSSKSHLRVAKTAPWLIGSANGEAQKFVDPCPMEKPPNNRPISGDDDVTWIGMYRRTWISTSSWKKPTSTKKWMPSTVHISTLQYNILYKGNHDLTWKP